MANIKTIDEILGVKPTSPFKANSIAEFEAQINNEMNLADMQAMAPVVGLIPIHDRNLLKKRLIDEFKKDLRKRTPYSISNAVSPTDNLDMDSIQAATRILKEGR